MLPLTLPLSISLAAAMQQAIYQGACLHESIGVCVGVLLEKNISGLRILTHTHTDERA